MMHHYPPEHQALLVGVSWGIFGLIVMICRSLISYVAKITKENKDKKIQKEKQKEEE